MLPVYNEAATITDCLTALSLQTIAPLEILVVDNNSTDATVELAQMFPNVRVIRESRQGVVYARGAGFNEARGELIARLDADTIVPLDWLETIQRVFATSNVAAFSGSVYYYDLPCKTLLRQIDLAVRGWTVRKLNNEVFIQATNSALTRSAWRQVRNEVCERSHLHEDFDLAIHLQQKGLTVGYYPELVAGISARCINDSPRSFLRYALLNPATYAQHGLASKRYLYPMVIAGVLGQPLLRLIYRVYNMQRLRLRPIVPRINPATNVD